MRSGCNRPGKARRRDGSRSADRHAIGVQQAGKGAPALGCDDHALLLVRWLRLGSVCGRRFAAGPRASSLPPRKGLEQISRRITFRSAGRSAHRSRPWRPLHRRPWSRSRPRATRGTPTALLRATRLRHGALTLASARAAQVAPDWLNGAHHRRAETGANFCVTTFGGYKFQQPSTYTTLDTLRCIGCRDRASAIAVSLRARTTRLPCALRVHAVDGPGDRGVRFPSGREFGGLRPSAPYTP